METKLACGIRRSDLVKTLKGVRKKNGEGVVQRNVVQNAKMDSSTLSVNSKGSGVLRPNLKGAEKKADSPKTPFWTTISPHDAFSAPLACSGLNGRGLTEFDKGRLHL